MSQTRTRSAIVHAASELAQRRGRSPVLLALRAAEFTLLYGGVPVLFIHRAVPPTWLMPFLVLTGLLLATILLVDPSFDNRRLLNPAGLRNIWKTMVIRFAVCATALTLLTLMIVPDRLLALPLGAPGLYLLIMVGYPVFSVYPQEIIFRTFLFHRYRVLFAHPAAMIIASAFAFSWGHVFFDANLGVTLGLSALGGLIFAHTYHRTQSTIASTIEHGLYGDFLFTVGLGWYFYTGSVGG